MSDSDSDVAVLSRKVPSKSAVDKALRNTVRDFFKRGKQDDLTLKRIRAATESSLKLEEGYLKTAGTWKADSERIIKDEIETQENNDGDDDDAAAAESDSPKSSKPAPKKRVAPETTSKAQGGRKKRRISDESLSEVSEISIDGKRQELRASTKSSASKKAVAIDSDEDEQVPPAKVEHQQKNLKALVSDDESDISLLANDEPSPGKAASANSKKSTVEEDDSEMSEVLDITPPKKRQNKSKPSSKTTTKKPASKNKASADLSPDEAEIKRLQSWLVKCGIRKMWFRELAPYETPKAKINHLKDMLKDAGMTGRFSEEKARQLKEEREFKADLEEIKDGAERWGKEGDSEQDGSRPKRRLARGLKDLQALLSDQSEDSD